MKYRLSGCVSAVLAVALAGVAVAYESHHHGKRGALPSCPVMEDDAIDLSVRLATPGGPVFFCCADCIDSYKEAPAKYAAKVAQQRRQLAALPKVQTVCPVTGEPVDKKITIGQGAHKVAFCCKGCIPKYRSNPTKYQAALANSYTYQTKCPVMGGPINPKAFVELADGRKIYFCCKGCDKKLAANPAKYLPRLEAQGIHLAAKDLSGAHGGHGDHKHQ